MVLRPLSKISAKRKARMYETVNSAGFKDLILYLKYIQYMEMEKAMVHRDEGRFRELVGSREIIGILPSIKEKISGINLTIAGNGS